MKTLMDKGSWLPVLAWVCWGLAMPVLANPLSPEERLDAIRQALVKRAMEGPTEVRASSFIDGSGVLREASSFVTGMEVRGVRVMAYGRDMDQQAAAGVALDSSKPIPPNGCKASKSPVWHQMTWESVSVPMPVAYQYEAQQVEFQLRKMAMMASQQSGAWRLNERKYVSDTYERLLVGQGEQHVPWQLRVSIAPGRDSVHLSNTYEIRWELVSRVQGLALYQSEQKITIYQPALVSATSRPLEAAVLAQIQTAVQVMSQGMERVLSCRVPQFEVLKIRQDSVRIAGGSGSGLKVGASVVLTDKDQLPSRALEPRAFDSLAMGEVVSVSEYAAEVKLKTSAKITNPSQWMAVPYMP
jgi:hypothetical protein